MAEPGARATEGAPLRWGVLSTARIATQWVMPAIAAARNARLVALGTRDVARAAAVAARFPGMRVLPSYEALVRDEAVEAVYNPLPNGLHAEWTVRAAEAGKHVLCEKPMGMTADEVRRMIAACRERGVLLMEAFMYRFHPQTHFALDQLRAGRIGEVRLVRSGFCFDIAERPGDIRLRAALAGGSLVDVGCYPLHLARAVYGAEPLAVAARVVVPPGSEVERTTAAVLDFGAGRLALIEGSFDQPARQFAEIVGSRGHLLLPRPFSLRAAEPGLVRVEVGDEAIEWRIAPANHYQLEVEAFGEAVRAGGAVPLPPEDALAQAEAIARIYAAAGYAWPRATDGAG